MKLIDQTLLQQLSTKAGEAPRRRANFNLHLSLSDPVQRFLNAMEPGTYVRPHRHAHCLKWELSVALSGSAVILLFDDNACVTDRTILNAHGPVYGVEIPAGSWHTVAAREPNTILLEFKPGPYTRTTDKDFAAWAPEENQPHCEKFEQRFHHARCGDSFSTFLSQCHERRQP